MRLLFLLVIWSGFGFGNDTLWTKSFEAYGEGADTSSASQAAWENAKPEMATFKTDCQTALGTLSLTSQYGYCAVNKDPLFCKDGCYTCPVYGEATCFIETNGNFKPGVEVEVTADAQMFTGNTQVGKVSKGDKYVVVQIKGDWISLKKADGTQLDGWLQIYYLKVSA